MTNPVQEESLPKFIQFTFTEDESKILKVLATLGAIVSGVSARGPVLTYDLIAVREYIWRFPETRAAYDSLIKKINVIPKLDAHL